MLLLISLILCSKKQDVLGDYSSNVAFNMNALQTTLKISERRYIHCHNWKQAEDKTMEEKHLSSVMWSPRTPTTARRSSEQKRKISRVLEERYYKSRLLNLPSLLKSTSCGRTQNDCWRQTFLQLGNEFTCCTFNLPRGQLKLLLKHTSKLFAKLWGISLPLWPDKNCSLL